jgi:hypothetical protein
MDQVDPAAPVELVKTFYDIVRFTRTSHSAETSGEACALSPSHQRRHGPKPGLLGATEGFSPDRVQHSMPACGLFAKSDNHIGLSEKVFEHNVNT